MKIGILTFHNADNYGAVLQCYALQEKLKELHPNDEIYVIDYKCPKIINDYIPKINLKKPWSILGLRKTKQKCKTFQRFRKEHFNLGTDDLSFYDVIYYGSDQIWNSTLTGNDITYFGKGFSGKKIAYAASDGGEMKLTKDVKVLLNTFFKISCREKSLTRKMQNLQLNIPIETVCDPVFLLTKEQWLKMAELPNEDNYILAYQITTNVNFDLETEKLSKKFGKKVIRIVYVKSIRKIFYKKQNFVEGISPNQFVGYFAKADYVLTTSFHGTAFSVLFDKPFFVLNLSTRSERVTDLLSTLGIEDRYGAEYKDNKRIVKGLIDYRNTGIDILR